jgi:RNA polymerase sigma-70 factor, ECF subfamily
MRLEEEATTSDSGARGEERALVRRMIAGEEAAFELFCADYVPAVYRFAQRRLRGDPELVPDIVQSTVCKAIAKLATFRGEAALMTWLCACCRNEIAAHFRRGGAAGREVDVEMDELPSGAALGGGGEAEGPERSLLRQERSELVHVALDGLPPRHARALEWKYLDGLPVEEIARRLEIGPKAAESLLTRARESFRRGYARLVAREPGERWGAMTTSEDAAVRS